MKSFYLFAVALLLPFAHDRIGSALVATPLNLYTYPGHDLWALVTSALIIFSLVVFTYELWSCSKVGGN